MQEFCIPFACPVVGINNDKQQGNKSWSFRTSFNSRVLVFSTMYKSTVTSSCPSAEAEPVSPWRSEPLLPPPPHPLPPIPPVVGTLTVATPAGVNRSSLVCLSRGKIVRRIARYSLWPPLWGGCFCLFRLSRWLLLRVVKHRGVCVCGYGGGY